MNKLLKRDNLHHWKNCTCFALLVQFNLRARVRASFLQAAAQVLDVAGQDSSVLFGFRAVSLKYCHVGEQVSQMNQTILFSISEKSQNCWHVKSTVIYFIKKPQISIARKLIYIS